VVLDVGRDLGDADVQAEGAHAGQALLPALADERGDPPGVVDRARDLQVERDERRARRRRGPRRCADRRVGPKWP
jgi:hypothetical protein